jgi:hypothetical protein
MNQHVGRMIMSPRLGKYSTPEDVIALVAAANPFPSSAPCRTPRVSAPDAARKLISKRALVVTCIALAVAAPAYAVRGAIGNLLDLDKRGEPASEVNTSLRTMAALRDIGLSTTSAFLRPRTATTSSSAGRSPGTCASP